MKKALGILSVLVLITVMMISCNAEQKLDDTVGVSFNVSSSRELSVANESFVAVDSPDLTWYYHGEKKTDTQFITGQSSSMTEGEDGYWTLISKGNKLATKTVEFSQGQWSFKIKAVKTDGTQMYYGETNGNVLLTKGNNTISISVSPFVSGVNGTLVLSNVYIAPQNGNANVEPNKLYINGTLIDITEDLIDDFEGGKAINYRCNVAPGSCTVEVKRVSVDNPEIVLASASKTVVVYSGLTTTISGSVEEDTTSGRFDVNNNEFVINTKEDLILFRDLVNEVGITFSGKTVKLAADINLAGVDWKPVGQTGATQFQGVFDGQGYTIKNMTVNNPSQSTNVSSGFFGWLENTSGVVVKNVKFDNANVTGSHYVGVVAGYLSGSILNCEVNNSTVIGIEMNKDANGDKVGAIVGFINAGTVDGNKVVNCTIKANRDAGGVTGAIIAGTTFTNNTVKDTNVYYITNKDYESAGKIVSGRTGFVPDDTNTATNVSVNKLILVSNTNKLTDAISSAIDGSTTVYITSGEYTLSDSAETSKTEIPAGTTIVGAGAVNTKLNVNKDKIAEANVTLKDMTIIGRGSQGTAGTLNINGNNTTIENIEYKGDGKIAIAVSTGGNNSGTIFRETKITNAFRGIQFWSLSGDSVIDNCVLDVAGYPFNIDAAVADSTLTITNSTLNGWTSYTSGIEQVKFDSCKLGLNTYSYLRPYSETTLVNCEFTCDGYKLNAGGTDAYTITLTNCTINGTRITEENVKNLLLDTDGWNSNATLIVNDVTVSV